MTSPITWLGCFFQCSWFRPGESLCLRTQSALQHFEKMSSIACVLLFSMTLPSKKIILCSLYTVNIMSHQPWVVYSCGWLHLKLNDFQNSCTIKLGNKRVMKPSLQIPKHLKRVATLGYFLKYFAPFWLTVSQTISFAPTVHWHSNRDLGMCVHRFPGVFRYIPKFFFCTGTHYKQFKSFRVMLIVSLHYLMKLDN